MAGFLEGLLGGGGDLYGGELGDVLSPAQRNAIQARGLLAMAGAFGDAAMPSRLPVPIGAVLGKAAGALGTGQDAAMEAAIKNALTVQQIKAARLKMQQQTDFLNQPGLADVMRRILAGGGPGVSGAAGVPAPGTYVGGGAGAGGGDGAPDLLKLGSDYASGLSPTPPTATSRFGLGERQYPATPEGGLGVGGGGLLAAPDAGLRLQTPTDRYRPGGLLDPFTNGAPPSDTAGAPKAQATRAADEQAARPESSWDQQRAAGQLQGPLAAGGSGGGAPPVAPPEAGGDTEAAAPDTVVPPGGGGLLGVSPDLYRPVEANPFARVNAVLAQIRGREAGSFANPYAVTPQQNVDYPRSHASGAYQFQPGTWREWTAQSGFGTQYPEAYLAPAPVQDAVARYAALHGNVNAKSLWGASAGSRSYPDPREGGAVDTVVPSPGGGGGNLPPVVQAQYAPGGGAPAPGGTAAVGGAQVPLPAGVDPAKFQALMLELADRSAKAEILGLGNPYGPMLQILQNSPQYKAMTETATRAAGLPFVGPEAEEKAKGAFPYDIATRGFQANLDRVTQQTKALGDAALAPAEILVSDGKGGMVKLQGTQLQKAQVANGFSVPELGIKGMFGPVPPGAIKIPGLTLPGDQPAPAPQAQVAPPPASGGVPEAGTPAGEPVYDPGRTTSLQKGAEAGWKALEDTHAAEMAANRSDQKIAQMAEAMKYFSPGATAEQKTQLFGLLKDLGLTSAERGDQVTAAETFQRAARQMQISAASTHQGQVSNYERELFASTAPQRINTPESLAAAFNVAQRLNAYDRQIAAIHRDTTVNGVPNLIEAQRRIAALGPPLSPTEVSAMEAIREGKTPMPESVPPDWKPAGTYKGKPAYRAPDGTLKVQQ